jgi:serine/threonine protein kinase
MGSGVIRLMEESSFKLFRQSSSTTGESEKANTVADGRGSFRLFRRESKADGNNVGLSREPSVRLARESSIVETKTLFQRDDLRSPSFTDKSSFRFDESFEWCHKLGSGSFADVWAVRHRQRPDEKYAIKRYKAEFRSKAERKQQLDEAQLASMLPIHEHVVQYFRAWQEARIMYVQMELCEGGTLGNQLGRVAFETPEGDAAAWRLLAHVGSGMSHVHAHGLLHLDIKPDNILIGRGMLSGGGLVYKLGDFGQAATLGTWDGHEGDAKYISKELLASNPSPAADVFSLGITLLEVKSGAPLPGHGAEWEALRSGAPIPLTERQCLDAALVTIVQEMMSPEPATRMAALRQAMVMSVERASAALPMCLPPMEPSPLSVRQRSSVGRLLLQQGSKLMRKLGRVGSSIGTSGP